MFLGGFGTVADASVVSPSIESSYTLNNDTTVILDDGSSIILEGYQGVLGVDFEIIEIGESVLNDKMRSSTISTSFSIQYNYGAAVPGTVSRQEKRNVKDSRGNVTAVKWYKGNCTIYGAAFPSGGGTAANYRGTLSHFKTT